MSFETEILTGGSPCECLPISHETRLKNAIRLVYSYSAISHTGSRATRANPDVNMSNKRLIAR